MGMTMKERDELRALQDRFLALPVVRYQIDNYGEDQPLAGHFPGGNPWPTFREVRESLHPDLKGWFLDFFRDEGLT